MQLRTCSALRAALIHRLIAHVGRQRHCHAAHLPPGAQQRQATAALGYEQLPRRCERPLAARRPAGFYHRCADNALQREGKRGGVASAGRQAEAQQRCRGGAKQRQVRRARRVGAQVAAGWRDACGTTKRMQNRFGP